MVRFSQRKLWKTEISEKMVCNFSNRLKSVFNLHASQLVYLNTHISIPISHLPRRKTWFDPKTELTFVMTIYCRHHKSIISIVWWFSMSRKGIPTAADSEKNHSCKFVNRCFLWVFLFPRMTSWKQANHAKYTSHHMKPYHWIWNGLTQPVAISNCIKQ